MSLFRTIGRESCGERYLSSHLGLNRLKTAFEPCLKAFNSVRSPEMEVTMNAIFADRREAGEQLANELSRFAGRSDAHILALPRGGVPVAFELARRLKLPLDVLIVRKLGVPGQEELAFGAIASGGRMVLNQDLIDDLRLDSETIERVADRERVELLRRESAYRGSLPLPDLAGKIAIIVDDGLATGATMRVAVEAVRLLGPNEVIVAVPVGSADVCAGIENAADVLCICARTPEPFYGVGLWYRDFSQTTDEEVKELLRRANEMADANRAGQ